MISEFEQELASAGEVAGTDKIFAHHYERAYARHLNRFRHSKDFAMVEIGYGSGAGIKFWASIFPSGYIYCLDRDVGNISDSGFSVIATDQSDLQSLRNGIDQISHSISLVVDDGSHFPSHQLLSLSFLFQNLLINGGIYIIEDVETSYWRTGSIYGYNFNYGLHDPWSTIEALKIASDYVNRKFLSPEDQALIEYRLMAVGLDPAAVQEMESIEFSRNCIVITKRIREESAESDYPFHDSIRRF